MPIVHENVVTEKFTPLAQVVYRSLHLSPGWGGVRVWDTRVDVGCVGLRLADETRPPDGLKTVNGKDAILAVGAGRPRDVVVGIHGQWRKAQKAVRLRLRREG